MWVTYCTNQHMEISWFCVELGVVSCTCESCPTTEIKKVVGTVLERGIKFNCPVKKPTFKCNVYHLLILDVCWCYSNCTCKKMTFCHTHVICHNNHWKRTAKLAVLIASPSLLVQVTFSAGVCCLTMFSLFSPLIASCLLVH